MQRQVQSSSLSWNKEDAVIGNESTKNRQKRRLKSPQNASINCRSEAA